MNFSKELEKKLNSSLYNNFGVENYDELRYGKYVERNEFVKNISLRIKNVLKILIRYKIRVEGIDWIGKYLVRLQRIYDAIDLYGKSLLVDLIAYKVLGHKKIWLKRNNAQYHNGITIGNSLADMSDVYDPHFMHMTLPKLNLSPIGFDVQMYFTGAGASTDFILEQYSYKQDKKPIVEVELGDIVLDAGACWGDTALYFAHKTGVKGRVYSFEFIPDNIALFEKNRSMNPRLAEVIELLNHPVSNKDEVKIFFKDNGPGSQIEFEPFAEQTGSTTTITIDSFVKQWGITRVDFIKMDIEGAELAALEGAVETIKKYKPKLAIAIYHSIDDLANIPNWILDLKLGYEIFIDHFTIHSEETICFARIK